MVCPQCGKSIANHATKVSLCPDCVALKVEEHSIAQDDDSSETGDPEENVQMQNSQKVHVNRNVRSKNLKPAIIITIVAISILLICVASITSKETKKKINSKKIDKILSTFSEKETINLPPLSPLPIATIKDIEVTPSPEKEQPTTETQVQDENINTNEIVAAEAPENMPTIESTIEITLSPSSTVSSPSLSPSPQVSPSPEKTIDETKLSEFDRRVLHTKRLKELEKK